MKFNVVFDQRADVAHCRKCCLHRDNRRINCTHTVRDNRCAGTVSIQIKGRKCYIIYITKINNKRVFHSVVCTVCVVVCVFVYLSFMRWCMRPCWTHCSSMSEQRAFRLFTVSSRCCFSRASCSSSLLNTHTHTDRHRHKATQGE